MKIGIEAQRLFRPKKHGMDIVVLEQLKCLQYLESEHEYVVFVRPDEDRDCLQPSDNMVIQEVPAASYPTWEQFALPAAAKAAHIDLLHCTSNTAPLNSHVPVLLTLHDIIYLEQSAGVLREGTWYQRLGNLYRKSVVPKALDQAWHVITVSAFERENILAQISVAPSKISVIHNGVNEQFKPVTETSILAQTRLTYGLPHEFIFFLGNTAPKKNLPRVIEAYTHYARTVKNPLPIVIADYRADRLAAHLQRLDCADLEDQFVLPGYIDNRDLPAIYSMSQLFLYPSLRESFGLPIVEAMACGTAVITANVTSMPEIAGNAALCVDPTSVKALTEGIVEVCANEVMNEDMRGKGILQAGRFSWETGAYKLLDIYNRYAAKISGMGNPMPPQPEAPMVPA